MRKKLPFDIQFSFFPTDPQKSFFKIYHPPLNLPNDGFWILLQHGEYKTDMLIRKLRTQQHILTQSHASTTPGYHKNSKNKRIQSDKPFYILNRFFLKYFFFSIFSRFLL